MDQVTVEPRTIITPPPIRRTVDVLDDSNVNLPGEIKLTQSNLLLRSYLTYRGFADDILESYNDWVQRGIYEQMSSVPIQTGTNAIARVSRVFIDKPTTTNAKNEPIHLTPIMCRNNQSTYEASLSVDLEFVDTTNGQVIETASMVRIGVIPVMLGSVICHLYGKTDQEKIAMGECPNDPLSYFIIKGTEKVILMQENMRLNRFFIFNNKDGDVICRMTMITHKGSKIITLSKSPDNEIKLALSFLGTTDSGQPETMPALAPFQILAEAYPDMNLPGTPDEIMSAILAFIDPNYRMKAYAYLQASFADASRVNVVNKVVESGVLEVELRRRLIGNDEFKRRAKFTQDHQVELFYELLIEQLFPHMSDRSLSDKLNQLALMISIYVSHLIGARKADDRNSWVNKRVETAGRLLGRLFINLWNEFVHNTQQAVGQFNRISLTEVRKSLDSRTLTETIIKAFDANSWGASGASRKENVTDNLKRESPLALYSHISLINTPTSRRTKTPSIRMVQMSQLGYVDPVETSEGANCGLVKAKAITARVTIDKDENLVHELIRGQLVDKPTMTHSTVVLLNGKYIGWADGLALRQQLVQMRRTATIYRDTSAVIVGSILYISTDGGRLTRPLLIVEGDRLVIEKKNLWKAPFPKLLEQGAVEYVDVAEQETIMLADSIDSVAQRRRELAEARARLTEASQAYHQATDLVTRNKLKEQVELAQDVIDRLLRRQPFTHCELDPNAMFGIASSIIPLPDHNQAPRNVYQTSMGKQALGIYHSNYHLRFDTTAKTLAFPTRPLFETQMLSLLGLNQQPIGQMVTVAIMTYGGYNQEDALIFNRASVDRGLFMMQVHRSYKTSEANDSKITETICLPELRPDDPDNKYQHLDEYGIARLGARIEPGQVIIGKIRYNKTTGKRVNASVIAGVGESGVVSSVLVTKNTKGNRLVRVKLTDTRRPVEGDKFASRHAQKATIGLILSEEDMPFTSKGVRPDLIINPHAIPSRMTIAKLIEIVTSKVAALSGERVNASAFSGFDIEQFKANLRQYGYQSSGNEVLYSGYTGRPLQSQIFIGPCYYQALRHHVKDKIQMRSRGENKLLTHQPVGGRSRGGGLRAGEMERDALISHGATSIMVERLCTSSDAYKAVFCMECGTISVSDAITGLQTCRCCGNQAKHGTCEIPYAYRLLQNLLAGAGMSMRFKLKEKPKGE